MSLRYQLTIHRFGLPFRKDDIEKAVSGVSDIAGTVDDLKLFRGVFGIPTNELWTMSAHADASSVKDLPAIPGSEVAARHNLTPTARPKQMGPLPQGGIFVLRWFQINDEAFDEFVALSDEAWVSMEASFEAIIIGLFKAERAPEGKIAMLLYTWYASHAEWERSRDARPEAGAAKAWENFMRRHLLTDFTEATVLSEVKIP